MRLPRRNDGSWRIALAFAGQPQCELAPLPGFAANTYRPSMGFHYGFDQA